MKKRVISLLLMTSLMVTMLGGCGNDDKTPASNESSNVESTDDTPDVPEVVEPVKLSILGVDRTADGVLSSDGGWKESEAGKAILAGLEELNIELEIDWVMFDNNTYKGVIANRVGTGIDVTDIVRIDGYQDNVNTWGRYGFVKDLVPLLEQYDEDGSIKQFFYDHGAGNIWENAHTPEGNLYYLPNIGTNSVRYTSEGEEVSYYNGGSFYIRKDWVEKLGYEVKDVYTPDEILDLVIEMREKDANGDGKQNECIYSKCLNSDFAGITWAFRMSPYLLGYMADFEEKNITVESAFESEYFDDYIDWMHRAVEAGVYDANYFANIFTRDTKNEAVAFENGFTYPKANYLEEPFTMIDYVPIVVDVEGSTEGAYYYVSGVSASGGLQMCITAACEDPEAAIRLFDYMYTDEFTLLDVAGVEGEGKGYTVDPNSGVVSMTPDFSSNEARLTTCGVGNMNFELFPYNYGALPQLLQTEYSGVEYDRMVWQTYDPDLYETVVQQGIKIMNEYVPTGLHGSFNWPAKDAADDEFIQTFGGQFNTAASEYFIKFCLGELSVEEDLDDVIKELNEVYFMQELIDANVNTLSKQYNVIR